jgi:hypothetical protein
MRGWIPGFAGMTRQWRLLCILGAGSIKKKVAKGLL